jgi:hypothetical protein
LFWWNGAMRVRSIALVAGLMAAAAASPANAAFIVSDANVTVDIFLANSASVAVSSDGVVTSDPPGATSITINTLFDATDPEQPAAIDGLGPELVVAGGGGSLFLDGDITGLAFDASDPSAATRIDFTFTPVAGTEVAAFAPEILAGVSDLQLTEPFPGFLTGTGELNVSQVPLPGALPLLLSGLGALALGRRWAGARTPRGEAGA